MSSIFRQDDNTHVIKRPKIAFVREMLDDNRCLSMNPFLLRYSRQGLSKTFEIFADDTEYAASILFSQTGVAMFNVPEADKKGYMYARQFYLAGKNGKSPELMLAGVFQDRVYKAFTSLRQLEKSELDKRGYDAVDAKNAMNALHQTYILARAVPLALGNNTTQAPQALNVA